MVNWWAGGMKSRWGIEKNITNQDIPKNSDLIDSTLDLQGILNKTARNDFTQYSFSELLSSEKILYSRENIQKRVVKFIMENYNPDSIFFESDRIDVGLLASKNLRYTMK